MDFNSAFQNKRILVPILQRDYVQGATESVIVPFIDNLLDSECDLNYIYGYSENRCFVPVDGQQRLITLWLLYLYIYSRKRISDPFNVTLTFQAREYASEFCERLSNKLPELLAVTDRKSPLDKVIQNQNWFITSWSKNATVINMLSTLRHLHKKINEQNFDPIYNRLFVAESPTVTFAFLNMAEGNGLDDDIYIKMNGRGRPLSVFENLKSWMDQRVEHLSIAAEWRSYMDNRWTKLFWNNRNKTQEHPEEIDDEQLHMFCNLMVLFHVQDEAVLFGAISETKFREELIEYLGVQEDDNDVILYNKILNNLTKGQMMPLVWIERLKLMPPEFFYFTFKSLNALSSERFKTINESGLYFGGAELPTDKRNMITRLYELSMTDSSFGRTLPLLYSAIIYQDNDITPYYDWLRVTRNLILNREAKEGESNANLKAVMNCLKSFAEKVVFTNIYDYLINVNNSDAESVYSVLNVFSNRQIQEEILKARTDMRPFYHDFIRLENLRFFSGRIKALFSLLPENALNVTAVKGTVKLLTIIFNGGDNGVTACFDDSQHYLRRVLMTYPPFYYGFERNKYWSFCNGLEEWRRYVRIECTDALKAFVREFASIDLSEKSLYESVKERVETFSKNYLTAISTNSEDSFKFHFIHHPGVWDYMRTKLSIWSDNNFDIVLKKTDSNNSLRMELRTYGLYLDYLNVDALKAQYEPDGWEIWCYGKGDTCFNLQRKLKLKDGYFHTLAIDIFFKGVDGKRDSENCYGLNVFVRTNEEDDAAAINKTLLTPILNEQFQKFDIRQDEKCGRFANTQNLSRSEIIEILREILMILNKK